jgi:hypothetical protein
MEPGSENCGVTVPRNLFKKGAFRAGAQAKYASAEHTDLPLLPGRRTQMFRAAAAKPALSRRASLVESSEQVKIETAILEELRKGLYSINEAMFAKDDSDRSAARFDAIAAYENACGMLNHSPFPVTEPRSKKNCGGQVQSQVAEKDGCESRDEPNSSRKQK